MRIRTAALLLLIASPLLAKEKHWEHGKVLSQEIVSSDGGIATIPVMGMMITKPITRYANQVFLQFSGYTVTLVEKPSKHYLTLVEGLTYPFYRDDDWFVFMDTHNHEHKFSVTHMVKDVK